MNDSDKQIRCGGCGKELDTSFNTEPRPACPACGSTARSFGIICETGQIQITGGTPDAELSPGNQVRDWSQRWETIQATADKIKQPSTEPLDRDTISRRRSELLAFYVQCYHLKDALRAERPNGVTANAVEGAITASQTLSLVADLCNLEKHATPGSQHPARSGSWPTLESVSGRTCDGGWKLVLRIRHGQAILDGLEVAEQGIVAWRQVLTGFGLI
jgi:hypothetical protein